MMISSSLINVLPISLPFQLSASSQEQKQSTKAQKGKSRLTNNINRTKMTTTPIKT